MPLIVTKLYKQAAFPFIGRDTIKLVKTVALIRHVATVSGRRRYKYSARVLGSVVSRIVASIFCIGCVVVS